MANGTMSSAHALATPELISVFIYTSLLFEASSSLAAPALGLQDISPDGRRFLALMPPGDTGGSGSAAGEITVVLNWTQELLERVPIP